ncbi:hypothetical protein AK812_SmicGene40905 [Symbiodinium microadriaticum]|uniref:Uncharacterized protein n=1 Tax=Symbiodinium microadriaticum TaxID=2951 RepID=A0A1Q9C7K1_SYMMI|nr:hypothetical protein AK812_SmicGene40905 [Symbiodinium microadriaticum]
MNNGCWINLFMLMMRKSANDNSTEAADVVRREPRQAWRSACNFLVFELPDHQSYMAFMVINCMHKNWRGNVKWLDLPLASMHQLFRQQKRYDVLGSWGDDLSRIDEDTGISRNVTDDEVLAYGQSLRDHEDPTGIHLLNKFKTNQLIAKLMRGNIFLMVIFLQANRASSTVPVTREEAGAVSEVRAKIDGNATGDVINGMKMHPEPDATRVNIDGTTTNGMGDLLRALCRSLRLQLHMLDMAPHFVQISSMHWSFQDVAKLPLTYNLFAGLQGRIGVAEPVSEVDAGPLGLASLRGVKYQGSSWAWPLGDWMAGILLAFLVALIACAAFRVTSRRKLEPLISEAEGSTEMCE